MKKTWAMSALVCALALPSAAWADGLSQPHLSVTGEGTIKVAPNMATFSVAIVTKQPSAALAKQKTDEAVANLLGSLMAAGLPKSDIHSANLSVYPQYNYPKDKSPVLSGYQGTRDVSVTVNDLSKLNDYLNSALNDGMNRVSNIRFSVKDKSKYLAEARDKAVQDAKQKAEALAKGFGVHLHGIWNIDYDNNNDFPMPMMAMNYAADRSARVQSSYQQSDITLTDRISVTYLVKNK